MNLTFGALAACLLIGGCAQYGTVNPPAQPDVGSPIAGTTASGASAAGRQGAGGPRARTRAEVHAEAVQAVKDYQSTLEQELEWFNPYAPQR